MFPTRGRDQLQDQLLFVSRRHTNDRKQIKTHWNTFRKHKQQPARFQDKQDFYRFSLRTKYIWLICHYNVIWYSVRGYEKGLKTFNKWRTLGQSLWSGCLYVSVPWDEKGTTDPNKVCALCCSEPFCPFVLLCIYVTLLSHHKRILSTPIQMWSFIIGVSAFVPKTRSFPGISRSGAARAAKLALRVTRRTSSSDTQRQ